MKLFYQRDGIRLYLGDSREILPQLSFGAIVTDPPYPDYLTELYQQTPVNFLGGFNCHQVIFWSAKCPFPLNYSAIHIWDKKTGAGSQYECIFERNGQKTYKVFRHYLINSTVAASYTGDIFTGHKSQKPTALMLDVISKLVKVGPIVDPFCGSGATLEAAYKLGYESIGIEIDKGFAEMTVDRLSRLSIRMPNKAHARDANSAALQQKLFMDQT